MREKKTGGNVMNEGREACEVLEGGPPTNGCVDEIPGIGGEEVPEYAPTNCELIELAKYWTQQLVEIEYSDFLSQYVPYQIRNSITLFVGYPPGKNDFHS